MFTKILHRLESYTPSKIKCYAMAFHVSVVLKAFSWRIPLGRYWLGAGEILEGTAIFPTEGFHVIDVGAYRGYYTAISSVLVGPKGYVYSFEPEPRNFSMLRCVVSVNRLNNVVLLPFALSDRDGYEHLYISEHPSMHSIVLRRSSKALQVKSYRLDTLVPKVIKHVDLIKIDVEGAEMKVLKGSMNTIDKFKPILSIDVNHYEGEFEEVRSFLKAIGYKLSPLSGNVDKPYSIVAYHPSRETLARGLIIKTKMLSIPSINQET